MKNKNINKDKIINKGTNATYWNCNIIRRNKRFVKRKKY